MAETKKYSHNIDLKGNDLLNAGNIYNKTEVDARTVDLSGVLHDPRDGKKNDDNGLSERIASPTWTSLTQYLNALLTETRKNLHGFLEFARKVRFLEMEYGRYIRATSYSQAATVGTFYRLRVSSGTTGEYKNQSVVINGSSEFSYVPEGLGKRLYTNGHSWRKILLAIGAEARITVTNSGSGVATTIKLVARVVSGGSTEVFSVELDRVSFTAGTTGQSFRLFGSDVIPVFQNSSLDYEFEFALVVSSGANNTVVVDSAKMYFHKGGWYRGQKVY